VTASNSFLDFLRGKFSHWLQRPCELRPNSKTEHREKDDIEDSYLLITRSFMRIIKKIQRGRHTLFKSSLFNQNNVLHYCIVRGLSCLSSWVICTGQQDQHLKGFLLPSSLAQNQDSWKPYTTDFWSNWQLISSAPQTVGEVEEVQPSPLTISADFSLKFLCHSTHREQSQKIFSHTKNLSIGPDCPNKAWLSSRLPSSKWLEVLF
jgi:hypothetical protein